MEGVWIKVEELEKLKQQRDELLALLVESQNSIGGDWRQRRDAAIWSSQDKYLGQLAKFKYFTVGAKDAPRHPVFLGWRDRIDL